MQLHQCSEQVLYVCSRCMVLLSLKAMRMALLVSLSAPCPASLQQCNCVTALQFDAAPVAAAFFRRSCKLRWIAVLSRLIYLAATVRQPMKAGTASLCAEITINLAL
eukprot:TRINITY_DN4070_c0_g1_i1.p2 TRINITY_DN4070_c0_g1~~TRINITY_DN4070_c0_g1_i1.p2  ORF type:complete len:107 (-),score=17.94 TRINITY_DN4070_c0_g1_i1:122-442(-)